MKIPSIRKQFDIIPKYNYYVDFSDFFFAISPENLASISLAIGKLPTDNEMSSTISADLGKLQSNVASYITNTDLVLNSSILVKSVTPPELTVEYTSFTSGAMKSKGNVSEMNINDMSIDFYRDTKGLAKQMYYAWLQLAIDFETGCKRPRNYYEKNIAVFVFDRKGEPVEETRYFGCCPVEINSDKLDANERTLLEENTLQIHVNNGFERITF